MARDERRDLDDDRAGAGGGDATEDIVVHEVPLATAPRWLLAKIAEGYAVDPKTFAGLYFLEHVDALFGVRG